MYPLDEQIDFSPLIGRELVFLELGRLQCRLVFDADVSIFVEDKSLLRLGEQKLAPDSPDGVWKFAQALGSIIKDVVVEDQKTLRIDFESESLYVLGDENEVESFAVRMPNNNIIIV